MDDNYVLKEGSPTSPMLDEHSTATIIEKTVDVSDIGEFIIGESNSSIITFRMNRYYDGVDLLEKTIKVMYRNSNGIFESDVVNIKYTSNSLKFSWIVPHDATTSKKLLAYVCFVSDGYLWKTKTFTITVDQSFDVGDSEPTQNWFVNIESKLTKIEKTIDEAVGKLSKQIPTKVSDLENDLAVSYSAQELTSEQKQQVRENINIGVSKKVVTYNGAKRSFTVGVIEGTIADLPEDSASEYLEAYKNFWHVCEYMRIFKLTTWQFAKNALKWLSSAHKNNIISDSLTFYVTKPSKYIKYSYNVNTQGRAYDLMEYYDEGATLKLSYYPDTDEFEDNQLDAKWSKPITMNSYGLDNNTPSVAQFELSKNPISDMEVATNEYVDDNIGVSKKVITYDGASSSHTILISEGTVNDIKSDSTEEFIEGYKTFYSAIQQTRFVETPYWRGLKTLLKKLSDAHRVGIISDKLTYSVDQSFTEINYSYGKARDNKYFDCIVFINNGKKARLSYYPDTDEYSTNDSDNYIKEALIKNTNGTDSTNSSVYQFNMDEDPMSDMQVATKQYVDKNSTKIDETLTTEQKATIRDNINAIGYDPIEIPCDTGTIPIIYMIDGTFTPLAEDANEELKTAYTSFVQFIKLSTSLTNLPVKIAQNMVKSFSKMCDNGIISSSFYFYETDRFDKSIKYERTEEDGKKVDTLYYDFRMRYTAVSYYPETDTFDTNPNYKEEQPLLSISDNNGKNFATKQFAMKSDPTENMEIATKQYVDNNTMSVVQGRDCPESLDTMTDTGYCYIQPYSNPYPSDFPDIADKTKDSVLICYRQTAYGCARQVLYNGTDKVFTRYGNPEMGNILWNDWTEIGTSSIMYIHVTSEEKDGETIYKSDKTYEEIREAIDSGKSPVVIYSHVLFNLYEGGNTKATFVGDRGIFIYDKDNGIMFVPKSNMISVNITVQDTGETVIACDDKNIRMSFDAMQIYQTDIVFIANVKKNNKQYNLFLQLAGVYESPVWSTTVLNVDDKLTYCALYIGDPSATSTWEYTETEITNVYTTITRNDNDTYASSLTFNDITNEINQNHRMVALYNVNNKPQILSFEAVQETNGIDDRIIFKNSFFVVTVRSDNATSLYDLSNLSFNLVYKSDDTKKLSISDSFYWMEDAYFYLSFYRTVNMNISDESTNSSRNISLYTQSIDRYDTILIGSEYINGDIYIYKVELIDGSGGQTYPYLKETRKLSESFLTSDAINTLIDRKLGVIENGTY